MKKTTTVKSTRPNTRVPVFLAGVGVVGVTTTSLLACKATYECHADLVQLSEDGVPIKDRVRVMWRSYMPAVASGLVTSAAIIGGTRSANRNTAAVATALTLSERLFHEYRDQVIEEVGEQKEQKITDAARQKRIDDTPVPTHVVGDGQVLCLDVHSDRYFYSDIQALGRIQNELNHMALSQDVVSLDEFYHLVGLKYTDTSGDLGWTPDKLLEFSYTSGLTDSGRPCLVVAFNYVRPL